LNPLRLTRSIKVKFSIVILAAIGTAVVTSQVGYSLGWPLWVRPTVAAAVSLIAVPFLAKGMTKPLRDMSKAARNMATGDYTQRVETSSVDEVGQLAAAFNSMAQGVADADRQQRDLIGNVSHELRTPIAGLRATLENIIDGVTEPTPEVLTTMAGRISRLERLVSDLLDLSRLEAGMTPLVVSVVNLREVVDGAVEECTAAHPAACITIAVSDKTLLTADPERLHQVVSNLLANAIAHGGGRINITAAATAGNVTLTVADQGRGLDGDADRLFERFYRADNSSTGTGLGLAIVRWIVDLHGGTVSAEPNLPTGARFIVTLPTT
jgi:two-component system, OmpR family, sensor histidine kinase BaeS